MARSETSGTADGTARPGIPGFKSSGVHILEPYISPPTRDPPGQLSSSSHAHPQPQPHPHPHPCPQPQSHERLQSAGPPTGPSTRPPTGPPTGPLARRSALWTGHIPADNVGFRLLRKAGWSVGAGLGAEEQGRRDPIEPLLPKGTRGLGFDAEAAREQQRARAQQQQGQQQGSRKRSAEEREGEGDPEGGQRQQRRGVGSERIAALVREELERESLPEKVARHRQLMRTEAQQERGRAIERYLRSAFNDPFDHLHSDNSNPLARRHKLTDSNPLLDPIGD